MVIKNCDGRRIKDCGECHNVGHEFWGGEMSCNKSDDVYVSITWIIPFNCPLPDWKRTLEVKE